MSAHFLQGLRDARSTLGSVWALAATVASLLVLAMAGMLEGRVVATGEAARGAQLRLLGGVVFGLVLPLLAFAMSGRLGGSVRELMLASWGRYGGNRQGYALGRQSLAALLTAGIATVLALLALGLGSATAAPGRELPLSFANVVAVVWVGALGSLAYVAAFAAAQAYWGNAGRVAFLIGDWVFGTGTSLFALPWPRAHLGALLGAHAPMGLEPSVSALCLVAIALIATGAYARRVPR
jgi:hypothetical protein